MWILILTIYAQGSSSAGNTIAAIPGFQTDQACLQAGQAWLDEKKKAASYAVGEALCVSTK